MASRIKLGIALATALISYLQANATEVLEFQPQPGDMTMAVREALAKATTRDIRIVFAKGTYRFNADLAFEKYCAITNHDNGWKKIIFPLVGFDSVEIEGNGAEFLFHGQVLPFLFENCERVRVRGIRIDWDIPFLFQGEVVAVSEAEGWRDIRPGRDGFNWQVKGGHLEFPLVDGFSYSNPGSTLAFEKDPKRVAYGAFDLNSRPARVEERPGGILRFHEMLKHYPPVGSILTSKGPTGENRYAPAIHVKSSSNIRIEDVVIHHALGMGILMEKSATAHLKNCGVYVREGSDRVVSITADATHFANCRGDIIVEGCRFEQMLDDGTNVHGTYAEVNKVLNKRTLRYELKHFQQYGFEFADVGDEVWFIHAPSPRRAGVNVVTGVRQLNERFVDLTFRDPLPERLSQGDLLENKTWNPNFTMRNCVIRDHRARSVVLKTPRKVVIENNEFSSMMSSIFFRGESQYWFESGEVQDVLIQNNHFSYCAYSGAEHAVLNITPRLGEQFDQNMQYDCNIRFINNTIETFDSRIVWADRVTGLLIADNKIVRTKDAQPLYPGAAAFDFRNCSLVSLRDNDIDGSFEKLFSLNRVTKSSLEMTVKSVN